MLKTKKQRWLITILAVAALGSIASYGVFGAFTATTSSSGNEVDTGSVTLGTNAAGSAIFFMPNAKPGDSVTKCIQVSYTGTINALVSLYAGANSVGALGPYVNMTITQGTQATPSFPSCTGFTVQTDSAHPTGVLYSGTLANFAAIHNTYANGVTADPNDGTVGWDAGDTLVYQFQVTLDPSTPASAEGQSTGPVTFDWQAQNVG
jgi:hypothetical protein